MNVNWNAEPAAESRRPTAEAVKIGMEDPGTRGRAIELI
jgi:hypothetical protein